MNFFELDEVYKKLNRHYDSGAIFKNHIENSTIFPLTINFKKVKQKDIQSSYSQLLRDLQHAKNSSFTLIYKQHNYKSLGVQNLPIAVYIESLEEFLKIIIKKDEYILFVELYIRTTKLYPTLKQFFINRPMVILEYKYEWENFYKIVDFFLRNSSANIYIREISLESVDTKYIQKYKKIIDILISTITQNESLKSLSDFSFEKKYNLKYPLAQISFRVLDKKLKIANLTHLSIPINEFDSLNIECKKVFIVENKITFLSFFDVENSIVLFGSGYGISVLKNVKWLQRKEIYYWGDIDLDGFAILSQARGYFANIRSIFMDEKTIDMFKNSATSYKGSKEVVLTNLSEDEQLIYTRLQNEFYGINFRLEQEKLPFNYIKSEILNYE
ncbi:MAG: hypothetical protein GQ570_02020 [Helicobacteraceae bacterium]|nr:hypothetical protein [Helicobacteraceae bacterium]